MNAVPDTALSVGDRPGRPEAASRRFTLGAEVRDADGLRVGWVTAMLPTSFVVDERRRMPSTFTVPYGVVAAVDPTAVRLAVPMRALRALGEETD